MSRVRPRDDAPWGRRGLLVIAAATALTAVLAGLARVGLGLSMGPAHAANHGPLFVLGGFGTVIALERAVALAHPAAMAAPALSAAAAVSMLGGLAVAPWLTLASSVALVAINVVIVRRQAAAFTWLMLLGSVVLALGTFAWARSAPVFTVMPAWMAFFVLTIVAERLELSRLAPTPTWASRFLVGLCVSFAVSALVRIISDSAVLWPFGLTMALIAGWQLQYDLARRTIRLAGLPRFTATGVLLGAVWLLVTGVLFTVSDVPPSGPRYDAALHGVFVGFVLSMVFAHAPIILPAVARVPLPYHPVLFVPLLLLHLGLVARVVGDVSADLPLRQVGSAANGVALAVFVLSTLVARSRGPVAG
ncbi:MAG: hypothetical protein MUC96_09845 [Myxococcaceae bacterium]|nr:hypothetical protein [Myxococcaceae bacterium]